MKYSTSITSLLFIVGCALVNALPTSPQKVELEKPSAAPELSIRTDDRVASCEIMIKNLYANKPDEMESSLEELDSLVFQYDKFTTCTMNTIYMAEAQLQYHSIEKALCGFYENLATKFMDKDTQAMIVGSETPVVHEKIVSSRLMIKSLYAADNAQLQSNMEKLNEIVSDLKKLEGNTSKFAGDIQMDFCCLMNKLNPLYNELSKQMARKNQPKGFMGVWKWATGQS
jgi:hypothetical protein